MRTRSRPDAESFPRKQTQRLKAARITRSRRIFVNRNLRMRGIEAVGFDMDHTLALYDPIPFEELAFNEARKKLIKWGYPGELRALCYNPRFVIRGLVVDKRRGNILKMDQHRYVARATHGTRPLADAVRKDLYQSRPIRISGNDFVLIDTPFSLPEIDLYAQIVDMCDLQHWRPRGYRRIYDDVRAAMDEAHADNSIKSRIAKDPKRYILIDPELPRTLHRMREEGYRLFLLTNSEADYTSLVMNLLLGNKVRSRRRWTEFFDLILVRARKPGFFRNRARARSVRLPGVRSDDEAAKCLAGGGVFDLERRLGCFGDRILYFGDHTYGDILKSKRVRLWRTALILRELEGEITVRDEMASSLRVLDGMLARRRDLDRLRDILECSIQGQRIPGVPRIGSAHAARGVEETIAAIRRVDEQVASLETKCERRHNEYWGPMLRTGREFSHFAGQVRDFACIYTGRVSNFAFYPMDKYFLAAPERMPHES